MGTPAFAVDCAEVWVPQGPHLASAVGAVLWDWGLNCRVCPECQNQRTVTLTCGV